MSNQTSLGEAIAKFVPVGRLAERLKSHDPLFDVPVYDCSTCQDIGYIQPNVPYTHPDFGKLEPCLDCERGLENYQARNQALLRRAGMPGKYGRLTFDSLLDLVGEYTRKNESWNGKRLAYQAAMQFVATAPTHMVSLQDATERAGGQWFTGQNDAIRPGLILSGPMGVGKTGLMAAIVNALKDQGGRPLYLNTAKYLEYLNGRYFDKDEYGNQAKPTPEEVKQQAMTAPVLALDELIKGGQPSDSKLRHMEDIFEHRKACELPTIVTCNQSPDQIKQFWGPIVCDRLLELCHFIPVGGEVLRDTWQPYQNGEAF
jgi:DNA replication protein DnaC